MKFKSIYMLTVVMLLLASLVVRDESDTRDMGVSSLSNEFINIGDWTTSQNYLLLDIIYDELRLDDYLHRKYTSSKGEVTLYVGYYLSSKKVGAAHDPMVCFPGQGWQIEEPGKGKVQVLHDGIPVDVTYSTMLAVKGETPLLLLYWFQAFDQTASSTLSQKIKLAGKTLMRQGQDNAFVRLSTPCPSRSEEQCKAIIIDFVNQFYPEFYSYVVNRDSL